MTADVANAPVCSPLVAQVLPVVRQHAELVDAESRFPVAAVQALRESGLMGLLVPTRWGGLGGDLGDLVDVAEQLASGCHSTALIWAMHCQQVDAIVRFGGDRLRAEVLPRVAAGGLYMASVTTDVGSGGNVLSAQSPLHTDAQVVRLVRQAPIVTGGEYADGFLITMRADAEASTNRVTLVYAHRDQLELERYAEWNALGMRGTNSVGMRLTGEVPASQVVGIPGAYREIAVESMVPVGYLAWAACWLGTARSALSEVVRTMRSAKRPRQLDPSSELVAERLARVRVDLELVSAYLHRVKDEIAGARSAGRSLDEPSMQIHVNTLKIASAEFTYRAVDRLVQLVGLATGYLKNSPIPLERHLRDLRSASLNYANDRLLITTGALAVRDQTVRLAGTM